MWKNILAAIIGFFTGMIVTGIIQAIGHAVVAIPEGFDYSDTSDVQPQLNKISVRTFIMILIARAAGSLLPGENK